MRKTAYRGSTLSGIWTKADQLYRVSPGNLWLRKRPPGLVIQQIQQHYSIGAAVQVKSGQDWHHLDGRGEIVSDEGKGNFKILVTRSFRVRRRTFHHGDFIIVPVSMLRQENGN